MARIRTIKPEFPQSQSMGRVSREARLLFVLLWTVVDDSGRTRGNSRMLASLLYPYDDDAAAGIDDWMAELEAENCLIRYRVNGNDYLEICNWLSHQKIDKPSKSKLPGFDEGSRILAKPREASSLDLDLDLDQGYGPRTKECVSAKREVPGTDSQESLPPVLDTEAFRTAWAEWLAHRGRGYKLAGRKIQLNRLSELGVERAVSAIRYSIAQGWKGIFEEHRNGNGREPKLRGLEGGTRVADTL